MADLHSALESCANKDCHMSLETRLGYMEALLGDSVCHMGLEEYLAYMETLLGDYVDNCRKLEAAHAKMVDPLRLHHVPTKTIICFWRRALST